MSNYVLWRRLTETDFRAIHGEASPRGHGGGAMHIALGVNSQEFSIAAFLDAAGQDDITIQTEPRSGADRTNLAFRSNPERRGGEWIVRDQFSHRHPEWSEAAGFPTTYDRKDPPYVLLFRVGSAYYARFSSTKSLSRLPTASIPDGMLSQTKGVRPVSASLLQAFGIAADSALAIFDALAGETAGTDFNPASVQDGRRRINAEVVQRQGQQAFRRELLRAYSNRCPVTGCATVWVLEAAHITPYMGNETNTVSNGLILRADVHTLFDLALISVEPHRARIRVSRRLAGSPYQVFDGRPLVLPLRLCDRPSRAALAEHYSLFLAN